MKNSKRLNKSKKRLKTFQLISGRTVKWILGLLHLFQTILLVPFAFGNIEFARLFGVKISIALSLEHKFLTRPNFQFLNICNQNVSFTNSPRIQSIFKEDSR